MSFATIGNAWLNHSVITEYLERADAILLRLNLVLLFFVFVLTPTHMLAEYLSNSSAERIAVTVYGLNLLAIGAFTSLTWHYALAEHLIRRDNSEDDVRAISAKLDPSLASSGRDRPGEAVHGGGGALPGHRAVRDNPLPGRLPAAPAGPARQRPWPQPPGLSPWPGRWVPIRSAA